MLFLCYPPPDDTMASRALTAFAASGGIRFAYVGEFQVTPRPCSCITTYNKTTNSIAILLLLLLLLLLNATPLGTPLYPHPYPCYFPYIVC